MQEPRQQNRGSGALVEAAGLDLGAQLRAARGRFCVVSWICKGQLGLLHVLVVLDAQILKGGVVGGPDTVDHEFRARGIWQIELTAIMQ